MRPADDRGRPGATGIGPGRDWRFWGLLTLLLLVAGLYLATPRLDSDQAVMGLMGMHVLRGELPIFFWKQDHAGVPEAYGAAVSFFLFGVSRVTLSLVPLISALGLVLVLYRTGVVLFGHGAGLLAMLFATIASPYVATHYVLARGYYIEHLLLGHIVLLGAALWLVRPLGEAARARALIAMGLAGGVGFYCGFQIVAALVPAALAVLVVDPWLPRRRGFWLGLGAFVLGSAPFWVYNLSRDWATFATGIRFQGRHSAAEAAGLLLTEHLPVILGMKEYVGAPPYLPWPLSLAAPTVVAVAVALLTVRVARGARSLRQDPGLAGEALLLTVAAVTLGAVWYGRYVQVPRYLLPLAPPLALVLARACQLAWRRSRVASVLLAAGYLAAVGTGLVHDLTVFWPKIRAGYWANRAEDRALFTFLERRGLDRTYSYEYWLAPRLTFDARETIIVAQPYRDRHPPYTRTVDGSPNPAYITLGEADIFAHWMAATQTRAQRAAVRPYTVFSGFVPPPAAVPQRRAAWTLRTAPGTGEPASLADARLDTGWASAAGPAGAAWIEVDLGRVSTVSGVTLVTDQPRRLPQILDVAVDDYGDARRSVARFETRGFTVAWRNGAPRTVPGHTLTARFAPVETRRVRLRDLGPAGAWAVAELFVLGPTDRPPPVPPAVEEGWRLEAGGAGGAALARYHDAARTAPDDPAGYAEVMRLSAELGLQGPLPDQAARYLRLGLTDLARTAYARVAEGFAATGIHAELARQRARLAAAAGDAAEATRLEAEAEAALAPPAPTGASFGRLVELTGYDLAPRRVRSGETVELTCYWRLLGRPPAPLVAYAHFRGEPFRFGDDRRLPAPIPGLPDGPQHVMERRRVVIPANAPPGRYRIAVGVWQPDSASHLRRWWRGLVPTTTRTVELAVLEVLPP